MKVEKDQFQLRITGTAPIETPPDATRDVIMGGKVSLYAVTKKDNQDGSFTHEYKGKFVDAIQVEQGGKKIRGIDPRRNSQKLRGAIYFDGQSIGVDDDQEFYDKVMKHVIANITDIIGNMMGNR